MEKTVGITEMAPNKPITRDMPVGEEQGPRLYTAYRDGVPYAYAYGDPWVSMALYMDDIKFKTPEEAKAWWEENYGEHSPNYLEALKLRKEDKEKVKVEKTNIYNEVEEHDNCTVQILRNSVTGEISIGWWENGE